MMRYFILEYYIVNHRLPVFVKTSVAEPWHFGPDPDPAIFVIDPEDANKKLFFFKV